MIKRYLTETIYLLKFCIDYLLNIRVGFWGFQPRNQTKTIRLVLPPFITLINMLTYNKNIWNRNYNSFNKRFSSNQSSLSKSSAGLVLRCLWCCNSCNFSSTIVACISRYFRTNFESKPIFAAKKARLSIHTNWNVLYPEREIQKHFEKFFTLL